MQVYLVHTACSMDWPSDAVITAQPQILARATPWRTCGVARQCAPRWTVCPPPRGRAATTPASTRLERVAGLYPHRIYCEQSTRLEAMILGSVLGWACAMRCFLRRWFLPCTCRRLRRVVRIGQSTANHPESKCLGPYRLLIEPTSQKFDVIKIGFPIHVTAPTPL